MYRCILLTQYYAFYHQYVQAKLEMEEKCNEKKMKLDILAICTNVQDVLWKVYQCCT